MEVRILNVENIGAADLILKSSTITGTDATSFSIETGNITSDLVLLNGEDHDFEIGCAPTKTGALSASFSLVSNDPNSPDVCSLACSGVNGPPQTKMSLSSIDYGNVST